MHPFSFREGVTRARHSCLTWSSRPVLALTRAITVTFVLVIFLPSDKLQEPGRHRSWLCETHSRNGFAARCAAAAPPCRLAARTIRATPLVRALPSSKL